MIDARAIRKVLEDFGLPVYSVRKKKRMVGGQRFDFAQRGLARQSHCKGTPVYFYQIELLSPADDDDYDLAVLVLHEAGYKKATHRPWHGLTFDI
jgi:hypothetical protein